MADGGGAVADLDVRDGALARAHALEEVALVVVALVEVLLGGAQGAGGEFDRIAHEVAVAADADGAFGADELDHRGLPAVHALHGDAVGVAVGLVGTALEAGGDELDRTGGVHAERPLDDVEVVRAPVAVLARTVFEKHAPAAAVVALHAELVVRIPRRGPEPAVVVQVGGDGLLGQVLRGGGESAELGADELDVAQPAVADDGRGTAKGGLGALLRAGLEHAAGATGDVHHRAALAHGERHRLLAVDVLAGLHGGDGDGGVPVVGGGDEDGIDVGAREEFLVRGVEVQALEGGGAGVPGVAVLDASLHLLRLAAPDVAEGHDLTVIAAEQPTHVVAGDEAVADDAHRDPVARSRGAEQPGGKDERRNAEGQDAGQTTLDGRATREHGRGFRGGSGHGARGEAER